MVEARSTLHPHHVSGERKTTIQNTQKIKISKNSKKLIFFFYIFSEHKSCELFSPWSPPWARGHAMRPRHARSSEMGSAHHCTGQHGEADRADGGGTLVVAARVDVSPAQSHTAGPDSEARWTGSVTCCTGAWGQLDQKQGKLPPPRCIHYNGRRRAKVVEKVRSHVRPSLPAAKMAFLLYRRFSFLSACVSCALTM